MAALNSNIDPSTPVGQFRILTGDIEYIEDSFEVWDDSEIEVFLSLASGSVARAAEFALSSLAAQAAHEAKVVKDYDLTVDLSKKSTALRLAAERFRDMADRMDTIGEGVFEAYDMQPICVSNRVEGWVQPRMDRAIQTW